MLKRSLSRFPWLPSAITWTAYALGVLWRWFHITLWHDPRRFLLADAPGYLAVAKRLAQPGYVLRAADTFYPPGNAWLLAFFLKHDPSQRQQVYFNFLICALLPLAIGALGWVTFGKRTAQAAVVIASGYFALIDLGAYFVPDVHLAFTATLTVASYVLAMKIAAGEPSRKRTARFVSLAALSGFLFSLAMALSTAAFPAVLAFCAVHFLFTRGPTLRPKAIALAVFLLASAPLTATLAQRCTAANNGHFCSGGTRRSADFLLGHYDRIVSIEWRDPAAPTDSLILVNPAAQQHGSGEKRVVQFASTDQEKSSEYAWRWIRQNPAKALVLSIEHVWDCFGNTYPWPASTTMWWSKSYLAHFFFLVFVLLPATIVLVDLLRQRGFVGLLRSMELLVFSPILGVCALAFATTGDMRSRIPWDGFMIVLALQFHRRFSSGREDERGLAPAMDKTAEEDRQAERRIRIVLLALGGLALLVGLRGIVWLWPEEHAFRASSGAWGFPVKGTVEARGDFGLFFHTEEEENPWVEIDVGALRDVDRVIVENRSDGFEDRAVPLVVELAGEDHQYRQVARRDAVFDRWTATFPRQKARYVKLHVPRKTTFHLRGVEIP